MGEVMVKVKSASRGFEPTRDFDRRVTGLSRWLKPLRHGRGCGLKGVRYEAVCALEFGVGAREVVSFPRWASGG